MSQLPDTVPTRFGRQEIPGIRGASGSAGRVSPRRAARPRRPHFVFSPALVQYFADLNSRRVPTDKDPAPT